MKNADATSTERFLEMNISLRMLNRLRWKIYHKPKIRAVRLR